MSIYTENVGILVDWKEIKLETGMELNPSRCTCQREVDARNKICICSPRYKYDQFGMCLLIFYLFCLCFDWFWNSFRQLYLFLKMYSRNGHAIELPKNKTLFPDRTNSYIWNFVVRFLDDKILENLFIPPYTCCSK